MLFRLSVAILKVISMLIRMKLFYFVPRFSTEKGNEEGGGKKEEMGKRKKKVIVTDLLSSSFDRKVEMK